MLVNIKKHFGNPIIIIIFFLLFIFGIIILYSATNSSIHGLSNFFIKQCSALILAASIIIISSKVSYKKIIIWGGMIHFLVIILLLFTLIKGKISMGAGRWIDLGFIKFQPSELAKISLPLAIIYYLFKYVEIKPTKKDWFILLFIVFFSSFLVIKQPDLGTGLVICISGLLTLFIANIPKKIIYFLLIGSIIIAPLCWTLLHDYQKKRILVFIGKGSIHKERYQIEQSKISVGSGGIYGKGYLQGTQKNLKFLPEHHTDFIFSVAAEEFGFLGILVLIFLYTMIFFIIFNDAKYIDNEYAYLLYFGITFPFFISVIFNIGMVIGLLPVVGIPLPCMSYGITHITCTAIMFGIINSISKEL